MSAPPVVFAAFQSGTEANGGVESITQMMVALRAYRPIVVTQVESRTTAQWRARGIEVHVWEAPKPPANPSSIELAASRARRAGAVLSYNARIARLVSSSGAPLVHCNDISAFWYTAVGARSARAKVVFNIRDMFAEGRPYGVRWKATRTLSDEILVLSQEMREAVEDRIPPPAWASGLRVAPVRAIHSIVDRDRMRLPTNDERTAARRRLSIAGDEVAIGYVGSVCQKKAQLEFLRWAAAQLVGAAPSVKLYFIGDFQPDHDDYASQCRAAVAELGLGESIRFVGFSAAVEAWYSALDVVCLASQYEGLARSMIEGLACGVPVVSFDVCSAREILERHECGIVLRQGDYDGLSGALAGLAHDPVRRASLGEAGARAAARLFDPDRIRGELERLYTELSSPRRATK